MTMNIERATGEQGAQGQGATVDAARQRMAEMANKLALAFGPVLAGQLLLEASLGLIEGAMGSEKACEYLRGVADEIEGDEDLPPLNIGHA